MSRPSRKVRLSVLFLVLPMLLLGLNASCGDSPAENPAKEQGAEPHDSVDMPVDSGGEGQADSVDGGTVDSPGDGPAGDGGPPQDGTSPDSPSGATIVECSNPPVQPPTSGTCTISKGDGKAILFTGTILVPGTVLKRGRLLIMPDPKAKYGVNWTIACVGCDCQAEVAATKATVVVCPNGVISPGLVNPHDHITYTEMWPKSHGDERYEHRHDWRKAKNGHTKISSSSNKSKRGVEWGEVRMLLSGVTSIAGSGGKTGLIRNLDRTYREGLPGKLDYTTFPLGDSSGTKRTNDCGYSWSDTEKVFAGIDAYLPHIAEGIDDAANNEWRCSSGAAKGGHDLVTNKTAVIHGIGLKPPGIAEMAAERTALIWSPRSNVDLYGHTAQTPIFDRMGVTISLGTDWTASGSMNMIRELRCADYLNREHHNSHFTDEHLFRMATSGAARACGVSDMAGSLVKGYVADLAIYVGDKRNPYRAIIDAEMQDVVLVLRGGKPLYGDAKLVEVLAGADQCDELEVCKVNKRICLTSEIGINLAALKKEVEAANPYPLFYCGKPKDDNFMAMVSSS